MLTPILTSACVLLGLILVTTSFYLHWLSQHWKRKGIPSYGNVITGIFQRAFRIEKSVGECLKDIYFKTKPLKFYGTFILAQHVLVIQDKEIIKRVLVKDYINFASHGFHYNKTKDPISAHLFNLAAADWKFMRTKLTPTFTSGKVKYMFKTVHDCIATFLKAVDKNCDSSENVMDMRELLACLSTDIISSVAFGIESNSVESSNSIFRKIGRTHVQPGWIKMVKLLVRTNFKMSKLLGVRCAIKEVDQFFLDVFPNTVRYREKNNVRRNDFLDLLIAVKNDETKTGDDFYDRKITDRDIAAQSFIFFVAGFETSASAVGFALFEMAKHPEIQNKVQEECDKTMAACGGNVTFEAVQSMEYTDRVLHETMRLYPAISYLPRAVTKACTLPTTDIFLEKDTIVWIPLLALHMDDEHFENPEVFDPDRFTEERKRDIPSCAYMPFGNGPRQCIAMRFALVEMKAVLLELMSRYNFELPDDNRTVEIHPCNFISVPKSGIMLEVTRRMK